MKIAEKIDNVYKGLEEYELNMKIELEEHPLQERGELAFKWVPKGCYNLLDVGCAHAYITRYFLKKARNVYGIDVNTEAIEIARKRYPKIKFKVAPAENIPYKKDMFDVVVMLDTFEHTQNEKKSIREIYQVIKPGGILIFTVPHKGLFELLDPGNFSYNFSYNFLFLYKLMYKMIKGEFPRQILNHGERSCMHRHYSLNEIENFFEGKFVINKVRRSGLFIYPLFLFFSSTIINTIIPKCALRDFLFKFCHAMMNIDYSIPFGSFSYNMAIYANTIKKL